MLHLLDSAHVAAYVAGARPGEQGPRALGVWQAAPAAGAHARGAPARRSAAARWVVCRRQVGRGRHPVQLLRAVVLLAAWQARVPARGKKTPTTLLPPWDARLVSRCVPHCHGKLCRRSALPQPVAQLRGAALISSALPLRCAALQTAAPCFFGGAPGASECVPAGLARMDSVDVGAATAFVGSCRNFDGGFGATPGGESHAGQIFTAVGGPQAPPPPMSPPASRCRRRRRPPHAPPAPQQVRKEGRRVRERLV